MARHGKNRVRVRSWSHIDLKCTCWWRARRNTMKSAMKLAESHLLFEPFIRDPREKPLCHEVTLVPSPPQRYAGIPRRAHGGGKPV